MAIFTKMDDNAPFAQHGHFASPVGLPAGKGGVLFLSRTLSIADVNFVRMTPKEVKKSKPKPKSSLGSSGSRRSKRKSDVVTASADDNGDQVAPKEVSTKGPKVYWEKDSTRTDRLLDWLEQNPADRQKLFSDSAQDAKEENRSQRVAKGSKTVFHTKIAEFVFSQDADKAIRNDYTCSPDKYAKSVENRIGTLKAKYREINCIIGQTGAGLKVEDITPGSNLSNQIAQLTDKFPYWQRLHGFWRTLPNFNPYTVAAEPGQNLRAEATEFLRIQEIGQESDEERMEDIDLEIGGNDDGDQYRDALDLSGEAKGENCVEDDSLRSEKKASNSLQSDASISKNSKPHFSHSRSTSVSSIILPSKDSKPTSQIGTRKSSASKRSRVDSLQEEKNTQAKLVDLTQQKLLYKTAALDVKRQRLDAEHEQKCQQLRYQAEERVLLQKEQLQEKEHQHQERMLRMRIELARMQAQQMAGPSHQMHMPQQTSFSSSSVAFQGVGEFQQTTLGMGSGLDSNYFLPTPSGKDTDSGVLDMH